MWAVQWKNAKVCMIPLVTGEFLVLMVSLSRN